MRLPLLALALLLPQDDPQLPVAAKDLAVLYRQALDYGFTRVTDRRLLFSDPAKVKTVQTLSGAVKVAAGETLLVSGDADAPVSIAEGGFLEVAGSLKADLDCAAGAAILVRGSIAGGVKVTLRDTQAVIGGRVDGMILVESSATDPLFSGSRPDPDQVVGKVAGRLVFRDILSTEDENLWLRGNPEARITARAAAKAEFRVAGEGTARVLLLPIEGAPLHRAMASVTSASPALLRPFCDAKFQKTLASIKDEADGGRRVKVPSSASVAWFATLKQDVTIKERLGVTVVEGDLPAGRSLRLAKVEGASSNLLVITGNVAGTLDISEDRGGLIVIGGDVPGVVLLGSDQRVLIRGSVSKGSTVQLHAGSALTVLGRDEGGNLAEAAKKVPGSACVVGKGLKAGLLRAGGGLFSVLEAE